MRSRLGSRIGRSVLWLAVVLVALWTMPAKADVVLLDEHWSGEILLQGVKATEVDTQTTGDPTQAVAGYFSALLENTAGAPNVRFRNAASLRPTDLPPDDTEARLWYRTDKWNGKWALEVWVNSPATKRPVMMLQGPLDGGGEGGRLVADDRWHQAKGILKKGAEYDVALATASPAACYVWLRPVEGQDIAHRTYVDRIEAVIVAGPQKGKPMLAPAQHVRPVPGAQADGPGLVWLEGEDAVESTFAAGGAYLPENAVEQRLLSGGAWLQHHSPAGAKAAWKVNVAEAGPQALWARGFWFRGAFRWRVDGGEWQTSGPDRKLVDVVNYREIDAKAWGQPAVTVAWTHLGQVDLKAGEHRLEIEGMPDAVGFGFDCWVLAKGAFVP